MHPRGRKGIMFRPALKDFRHLELRLAHIHRAFACHEATSDKHLWRIRIAAGVERAPKSPCNKHDGNCGMNRRIGSRSVKVQRYSIIGLVSRLRAKPCGSQIWNVFCMIMCSSHRNPSLRSEIKNHATDILCRTLCFSQLFTG